MPVPHQAVRRRLLLALATTLAASAVAPRIARAASSTAPARPIEIGILPYMPTATLIAGHQALRHHFELAFKRPVALSTAPDFHAFQSRVVRGDFDFVIIGPGPGWQAHIDHQHEVIAVSRQQLRILILVARDAPFKSTAELRGKTVAVIDPLTVTAQTTMLLLREQGLQAGSGVTIRHEKTPFNCAQAVALGEVDAAGFPDIPFPSLPAELRDKLRILQRSDEIPGVLFTVRPAADMPTAAMFQAELLRFADTEGGKKYVKDFNHGALIKPDLKALRSLDRFVPEVRRLMGTP